MGNCLRRCWFTLMLMQHLIWTLLDATWLHAICLLHHAYSLATALTYHVVIASAYCPPFCHIEVFRKEWPVAQHIEKEMSTNRVCGTSTQLACALDSLQQPHIQRTSCTSQASHIWLLQLVTLKTCNDAMCSCMDNKILFCTQSSERSACRLTSATACLSHTPPPTPPPASHAAASPPLPLACCMLLQTAGADGQGNTVRHTSLHLGQMACLLA